MYTFKKSKNTTYQLPLFLVLIGGLLITACSDGTTSGELGSAPTSEDVTFKAEPNADNPNVIQFINTSDSFKALWDFGNGSTARGDTVTGEFPLKGEYTVSLTVFTKSGHAKNTQNITIEETNELMLNDPDLNLITGGADQAEGKTWVVDSTQLGHMGVGPTTSKSPDWWQAPPKAKPGTGLYTDEYTFKLDGFSFDMETNGYVFINGNNASDFSGAVDAPGGDKMAPWTAPDDLSFNLNKNDDGSMFLEVSDPGFLGFYAGVHTYEILELSENLMVLRFEDSNDDLVWYHRLIPKGYEYPPEILPYKSEELEDNFDEEGNVDWSTDQITNLNENYDNPAPLGGNTSTKVAKYEKGEGQFENLYIDLGYELNLNERSIIRLKAYLPSYNDYETVDPNAQSWAPGNLLKQVEVKLHNVNGETGLGGNSWQTQETVVKQVEETGKWVDLEFDFSGVSGREDFDRIIIQIGGEGHGRPGIFFIDDFQLTSAN